MIENITTVLFGICIFEQVLSFTADQMPKSIIQLFMMAVYQTYGYFRYEKRDDTSMTTTKTIMSTYSVSVGPRY